MNIKELSIGDYVMFQGETYMVEEILEKGNALHLMILKIGVRLQLTSDYIADVIEPVPLSDDILTKIGFKWSNSRFEIKKSNEYNIIVELDDEDSDLFYVSAYGSSYECCGCARSVHELQHIIRLAKIEKEIVL